ncbi:venom serine carboxypeptidase isoform X2 [Nasonia vitripennis]|uniref:Carboxypeptidase n=1 Tax=Nasonia vitripennis TaxID=7425 RepID=A0A7M7GD42_NASVI|nr:venom serine carboxypeptidase isoform X2 [Nasonia vitripennis]
MRSLILTLLAIAFCDYGSAFTNVYPKLKSYPVREGEDVGDPLFLTPLIESGKIDEARQKASVQHKEMADVDSYAGYFTVNKQYNSNLFFWFFPAKINPENAPVVLWLQGGPGATSLYGLFTENGPFIVTEKQTLKFRKYSWNINHNVIYIDNPVGTGYSFTENEAGYATNETDVGRDMHEALVQFFSIFPELRENEFYVTGESYAGKYVPAVSHAIKDYNVKAKIKINLQGLAIGDGWTDPINQINYGDYLYQIGLIDFNAREQFTVMESKAKDLIKQGKYLEAGEVLDNLIDGDFGSKSLFQNLTGYNFYFNYLHIKDSNDSDLFAQFVQRPDIRKALHVGNRPFNTETNKVEKYLRADTTKSAAYIVEDLIKNYRILIYNGQLDIICAYPMTVNYLRNLDWPGAEKYKTAERKHWWVGNELAGYTKSVDNLTEVLVRNAGHMVPGDQPMWAWVMITHFTHRKHL